MSVRPKFDLEEAKRIVREYLAGRPMAVRFTAQTRSTVYVVNVLMCSVERAIQVITKGLLTLESTDFSQHVLQWGTEVADVYGLENYEEHNWYVKFIVTTDDDGRFLEEISFHPVEKELVLQDGRRLAVTYDP